MSLPKDWEIYAGIAFHALIPRLGEQLNPEKAGFDIAMEHDMLVSRAIRLGIYMAKAVEKKEEEEWDK